MTEEKFDTLFEKGKFDMEYAEYIYEHGSIGNGDMLIAAIESGDYYEDFKAEMLYKMEK